MRVRRTDPLLAGTRESSQLYVDLRTNNSVLRHLSQCRVRLSDTSALEESPYESVSRRSSVSDMVSPESQADDGCYLFQCVEQAWCGIYGMAPTIQAQHVVAVTIPTIAVLVFTYLWYKKRSNSISRSRNDPGGGGGTSRKRTRHRNSNNNNTTATATAALSSSAAHSLNSNSNVSISTHVEPRETFPEAMKSAMQKAIRDLETASPIQEICSDAEEGQSKESESSQTAVTSEMREEVDAGSADDSEMRKSRISDCSSVANGAQIEDANQVGELSVACVDGESTRRSCASAASPHRDAISVADERKDSESKCASSSDEPRVVACCNANRPNDSGENLDAAMLKLESMRLNDSKAKRKPTTVTSKRQNANSMSPASPSNDRSKSPSTSALLQLASSPPSKARKRRSKRRLRASQNGGNGDEAGDAAAVGSGETAAATTTPASKVACDSEQNVDACRSGTDNKAANRKWASDSEKVYYTTRENDRLSCSIKESRNCDLKVIENHQKDCDNERDSANHSPVDTMLDCPSAQFSDAHSEGSSDSGKGCSEGAISPPPQTAASSIAGDQNALTWYQFIIPQEHVGKLIGKSGQFINTIKASSNTKIFIKKHPTSFKKKICALEGTQAEINKALELIRIRFPEETYPDLTLDEFPLAQQPLPPCPVLRTDLLQLNLVEGVNNDVVISSIVTAGHLFLQQPMHPSYQSLLGLNLSMNHVYSSPEAPLVSKPAKDVLVAAPAMGGWYRARITAVDEESQTCEVRFVDYGGYLSLSTSCLRAIRADFMALPFQAVECLLANIAPINDSWCEEAKLVVQGLTYGQILQAQVCDFVQDVPLILLYVVIGSQVILINDELIARGFAYSTVTNEGGQSEDYYAYS